jgi:hypothetical protein
MSIPRIYTNYRRSAANEWLSSIDDTNALYIFLGKSTAWDNDNAPPLPQESTAEIFANYTDMLAMKRVNNSDFRKGIRNITWVSGTAYNEYNSIATNLFSNSNFYVVTSALRVYKCISNNNGGLSTVEPIGTQTSIITTGDNYRWKYMYSIPSNDAVNFVTDSWIPVYVDSAVAAAAVDGTIEQIKITAGGSGYTSATVTITSTTGTSATATAVITAGVITAINMTNVGSGYRNATVTITGNGTGATAYAVISPYGGHGKNPIQELGSKNLILSTTIIGNEDEVFPIDVSFRKVGLIVNPLLLDNSAATSDTYAGSAIKIGSGEMIWINYRQPIVRTSDSSNQFNLLLIF